MTNQLIRTQQSSDKIGIQKERLPSVSLVISNFNGKGILRQCMTSLLRQDYAGAIEIIVVDAGSTDGSPEMLELEFPEIKLIRKGRVGIGEAVNSGFQVAQGEILAFDINTDEILTPKWLQTLVEALLNIPNAGIVGGVRVLYGTKDTVDDAGASFNYLGIPSTCGRVKLSDIPKYPRKVDYVGTPLFHKKILNTIGLCDETYFLYSEDEDFCFRAKRKGYPVIVISQAVSYHRRSATIGQASPLAVYYIRRNHIRFIIINFPLFRMCWALGWHILILTCIEALVFTPFFKHFLSSGKSRLSFLSQTNSKQNFRATIEAICWNFRNLRSTISARQRTRSIDVLL